MDKYQRHRGHQITALFLLGCLLFNYPVISLFSHQGLVFGIPSLYVFFFVTWALLIGWVALLIEWPR